MTDDQVMADDGPPPGCGPDRRSFPPCACPQCGANGRPEISVRLDARFKDGDPSLTNLRPLAKPYAAPVRALAYDTLTGRVGVVMDRVEKAVFMRPEGGGEEWETHADYVEKRPGEPQVAVHIPPNSAGTVEAA